MNYPGGPPPRRRDPTWAIQGDKQNIGAPDPAFFSFPLLFSFFLAVLGIIIIGHLSPPADPPGRVRSARSFTPPPGIHPPSVPVPTRPSTHTYSQARQHQPHYVYSFSAGRIRLGGVFQDSPARARKGFVYSKQSNAINKGVMDGAAWG